MGSSSFVGVSEDCQRPLRPMRRRGLALWEGNRGDSNAAPLTHAVRLSLGAWAGCTADVAWTVSSMRPVRGQRFTVTRRCGGAPLTGSRTGLPDFTKLRAQ